MVTNALQAVQTYQPSMLARLQNLYCFIATCNTRFKDFETLIANLGSTVTFGKPPRMLSNEGLVVNTFSGVEQRVQSLTVGGADFAGNLQQRNVNFGFTAQELIFNIDNNDYRRDFEMSAVAELGPYIESSIATNILSSTYRFYGDGVTAINSYGQLAQAVAQFRTFGNVMMSTKGYLQDIAVPAIISSGLQQFVMNRNEEIANDWEVGRMSECDWYRSNLLPVQISGTVGETQQLLTLISVSADGTQLTFSGATISDGDAVHAGDLFQFQDAVSGQPNIRFLTFTGHIPCAAAVQFCATAPAAADGSGNVVITVNPPLISDATNVNVNLSVPLAAGMQVLGTVSHRAGLIVSGNAFYLGMPRLPDQAPYATANESDEGTGVSIRLTTGAQFGQNLTGTILDAIWGGSLVSEYAMRVLFPL